MMPCWAGGSCAREGDGDWGCFMGVVVRPVALERWGSTLLWEGPLSAFLEPTHGEQASERT